MTTVEVLFILISAIFLVYICLFLNCFNIRGKNIIRVKHKITILWIVLFVLFSILFVSGLVESLKHNHINNHYIKGSAFSVYWIVFSLYNIVACQKANTITEKGIYIDNAFYRWKKIESYRWVDENILEFRIKTIKRYINRKLEVDVDINRSEVDKILKEYIMKNKKVIV